MSASSLTEDQQTRAPLEDHAVSLRGAITLLLAGAVILWISAWTSINGQVGGSDVEEARFIPGLGMAKDFGTAEGRE